jgi:aspartyl aminopeptidase
VCRYVIVCTISCLNNSHIQIPSFGSAKVGSQSITGAGSPIIGDAVRRISHALMSGNGGGSRDGVDVGVSPSLHDRTIRRSFCLSVDMAHAVHPNYASKHEKGHGPKMNGGMVIKRNSNQRYATSAITGIIVRELARRANLPAVQEFVVRNDCGCGSTIGPILSANTGIRTIDMGCPQLSMHSIRETMGVKDLTHGLALFRAFFEDFAAVDDSIEL